MLNESQNQRDRSGKQPTAELWRNHLLPSTDSVDVKFAAIATYANVQATLQSESLRVKAG